MTLVTQNFNTLHAPVDGVYMPLKDVPDAAMASGALGPGIAVEPLSNLICAPASAEVVAIARTLHAITLKTDTGTEILIHIGIDTVRLNGRGFDVKVKVGDIVQQGEVLVVFDAKILLEEAASLCTPIIVLDRNEGEISFASEFGFQTVSTPVLNLHQQETTRSLTVSGSPLVIEGSPIVLELEAGLHARPAAQIAKLAKSFACNVALVFKGEVFNAKSVSSLMRAGLAHGDTFTVRADGLKADECVSVITQLIKDGAGDSLVPVEENGVVQSQSGIESSRGGLPDVISGVVASSGDAIGPTYRHTPVSFQIPESDGDVATTKSKYLAATKAVKEELLNEAIHAKSETVAILEAHAELVDDPDIEQLVLDNIAKGLSAGNALILAVSEQADAFIASGNARLIERVADLKDVQSNILIALYGLPLNDAADLEKGTIVLAEDLLPSEFMDYVGRSIGGICLSAGGKTSHVSILAASHKVPALVAAGSRIFDIPDGTPAILDTKKACLKVNPSKDYIEQVREKRKTRRELETKAKQASLVAAVTKDGVRIPVYANLASLDDASQAVRHGAEGCGLLRTEFLFDNRTTAPSEDFQAESYEAIVSCLNKQPLTIRTLDIGGDKPVPFLDLGEELNPALGLRGIRTLFANPKIMKDQVCAILRAAQKGDVLIMVPMVASASELKDFKSFVVDQARELGMHRLPPIGTMIETPSSAVIADQIAEVADFMSIGTNDLTQYTLAMDRGHPALAGQMDGLHPAVLRLIDMVGKAGKVGRIDVSVCGGLASDPLAVPLLIGLGVRKLSVVQAMIGPVKSIVRDLAIAECEAMMPEVLKLCSADEVREFIVGKMPDLAGWT